MDSENFEFVYKCDYCGCVERIYSDNEEYGTHIVMKFGWKFLKSAVCCKFCLNKMLEEIVPVYHLFENLAEQNENERE